MAEQVSTVPPNEILAPAVDEDSPFPRREGGRGVRYSLPVAFEHVTFRYAPTDQPALRDVSFEAGAGQTIALVGRSGSGTPGFSWSTPDSFSNAAVADWSAL